MSVFFPFVLSLKRDCDPRGRVCTQQLPCRHHTASVLRAFTGPFILPSTLAEQQTGNKTRFSLLRKNTMSVLVLRSTGDPAGMRVPRPLSDYSRTARLDHFEISGSWEEPWEGGGGASRSQGAH